jgi:hypothetical protein
MCSCLEGSLHHPVVLNLVGTFGVPVPYPRFIFFPIANAFVTDYRIRPGNIQKEQAFAKRLADSFMVSSLRTSA